MFSFPLSLLTFLFLFELPICIFSCQITGANYTLCLKFKCSPFLLFFLDMYDCLACISLCGPHMCLVLTEVRTGYHIPWVLETEPRSSARTTQLNCWAISLTLFLLFSISDPNFLIDFKVDTLIHCLVSMLLKHCLKGKGIPSLPAELQKYHIGFTYHDSYK